ncbi:unnamed protein product [Closterium sp. NIES-54]
MVTTTTHGGQRVSICTCTRTGRHLATFTLWPGSSLYTLVTEPPQVAASAQVSASGPVAAPRSCRLLSHQTLLWHHRLGNPSLPCLRGMHSRLLVSGLPRSLPPFPPSRALPCLPCIEGRQRVATHSSSFPPTTAPLQTLHMDVWGPARVIGQGRERYFLLVVDVYMRYSTVFPLRSKGEVSAVLIPWIRAVRLQLRERFRKDLPVLPLHSDRGGEFSSDLLRDFCRGERILYSFTLPGSPQKNGVAERRISLVMEVARTSMIHAAAPHFLWPFATLPTLRWTGKVGDASVFRVWGSRAFVCDTSADKLSSRDIAFVFLGFPLDAPGRQFYHPTSRPPLGGAEPASAEPGGAEPEGAEPGGAETEGAEPGGAESEGAESWGTELRGTTSARGPAAGGAGATSPGGAGVTAGGGGPGGAGAIGPGGARTRGTGAGGIGAGHPGAGGSGAGGTGDAGAPGPGGARTRVTGAAGAGGVGGAGAGDPGAGGTGAGDPGAGGAGSGGARAGGAGAGGTRDRGVGAGGAGDGGAGAGGAGAGGTRAGGVGAGDPRAGGADGGGAGAGGTGAGGTVQRRPYFVPPPPSSLPPPGSVLRKVLSLPSSTGLTPRLLCLPPHQSQPQLQPDSPLLAPSPYVVQTDSLIERHEPASRPALPVRAARTGRRVPRPRPPPVSGTHIMALLRAAGPTVPRLLATVVTDPSFESAAASALFAELVDFAAACRLDYAASLVVESESGCPPSVGGECALGTDVLEGREEEFECLAAAVPHLMAMLLASEGDPDAPDIPTPRSYAETITGPYYSQWETAMDIELASWKSTGTYIDAVPRPGANIVDGMWIFRVKRPPSSPRVFKARYVARGFSRQKGVDFFQTFSPTPKMTTLRALLHVAAQRDYELHSLDFSTAFLQSSLHEEIWLRRPPGFTGSFPAGT